MTVVISRYASGNRVARVTGGLYLGCILASVIANSLGHIGLGTTREVYTSIQTNLWTFRLALVIALVSGFLFLATAYGLFVILRGINENVALLFLLLNAVGVAVQAASMLSLVSAISQGDSANQMQAFTNSQLEALGLLSISVYKLGWVTAQLFFCTWLFPLGYLIYKSKFLPRFLGVVIMLDGIGVLIWFLQVLLWPSSPEVIRLPGIIVSFLAEVGLAMWLVVKGVKELPIKSTEAKI